MYSLDTGIGRLYKGFVTSEMNTKSVKSGKHWRLCCDVGIDPRTESPNSVTLTLSVDCGNNNSGSLQHPITIEGAQLSKDGDYVFIDLTEHKYVYIHDLDLIHVFVPVTKVLIGLTGNDVPRSNYPQIDRNMARIIRITKRYSGNMMERKALEDGGCVLVDDESDFSALSCLNQLERIRQNLINKYLSPEEIYLDEMGIDLVLSPPHTQLRIDTSPRKDPPYTVERVAMDDKVDLNLSFNLGDLYDDSNTSTWHEPTSPHHSFIDGEVLLTVEEPPILPTTPHFASISEYEFFDTIRPEFKTTTTVITPTPIRPALVIHPVVPLTSSADTTTTPVSDLSSILNLLVVSTDDSIDPVKKRRSPNKVRGLGLLIKKRKTEKVELFCSGRTPYDLDGCDMIQCVNGSSCSGHEWYHCNCVGLGEKFIDDHEDIKNVVWMCEVCGVDDDDDDDDSK